LKKKWGDHMKKILLLIIVGLFLSVNAFGYDLTYTNTDCLVDGITYATVDVTVNTCTEITVYLNESPGTFTAGPNFGMQKFGFNYTGKINSIACSDPDFYIKTNDQMDGFGKYDQVATATGWSRAKILTITVCGTDLNIEGCFAAHIAGFIIPTDPNNYCDECVTSAFFSNCAHKQKTAVPTDPCDTTLINLSQFKAIPANRKVILVWATESEIDNVGFNIYRAESAEGEYIQINDSIIPAKGSSVEGAGYHFIDTTVKNRKAYYYKLEDVDINDTAGQHGPVSATPRLIFGKGLFKK
jgi:hypothetical protein